MKPTGRMGVYVHFPFCASRCPYCDFAVDVVREIPHEAYASAVLAELNHQLEMQPFDATANASGGVVSIYFGGGTPSMWAPEQLERIIVAACERLGADPNRLEELEITLEANPFDARRERLLAIREAGVNRLSLGTQSFDPETLRFLGRRHTPEQAIEAYRTAWEVGFSSVTLDLIGAIPRRGLEGWLGELDALERLNNRDVPLEHVSVYELTIHEDTHFGLLKRTGKLRPCDEDVRAAIYEATARRLQDMGLSQYEVSNYAKKGARAVHNGLYWSGDEYIGLGVGAHSMRVTADGVLRFGNTRLLHQYLALPTEAAEFTEQLSPSDHLRERVFLGCRTADGLDLGTLAVQLGVPVPDDVVAALDRCVERDLLTKDAEGRYSPTRRGFQFADTIAEMVL